MLQCLCERGSCWLGMKDGTVSHPAWVGSWAATQRGRKSRPPTVCVHRPRYKAWRYESASTKICIIAGDSFFLCLSVYFSLSRPLYEDLLQHFFALFFFSVHRRCVAPCGGNPFVWRECLCCAVFYLLVESNLFPPFCLPLLSPESAFCKRRNKDDSAPSRYFAPISVTRATNYGGCARRQTSDKSNSKMVIK